MSQPPPATIDLATLLQTAHELSSLEQPNYEQLAQLSQKILIYSGADLCSFLLVRPKEWKAHLTENKRSIGKVESTVLSPVKAAELPLQLINYVQETLTSISSEELDEAWGMDPYLQMQRPQGFLCTPIHHQDRLFGLLYLEHRQTGHLPKPTCHAMVQILCQQLALTLENTRLNDLLSLRSASLENALDGIAVLDKGQFIYMNQVHANIFGYSVNDLIGQNWEKLYSDQEAVRIQTELFPLLEREGYWQGETLGLQQKGSTFVQELTLSLFDDNKILCVCRDISDRQRAEQALQFTQYSIDLAAEGILWIRPDGSFMYANQAMTQLYGYSYHELITMSVFDLNHEISSTGWQKHWGDVRINRCMTLEAKHQDKVGRTFPVEILANFLEYNGQEYIFACLRDISDRKQNEQSLQASQAFFKTLLNSIPDPVFVKDEQSRYLVVNDAFCAFTGYGREALINNTMYDFYPKDEADVFREIDIAVFRTGGSIDNEEKITDAEGRVSIIATRKTIAEGPSGKQLLIGVIRDITSLKNTTAELQESQQLLQLVMDTIPQTLFWKDRNSIYLGVNQAFAEDAGFEDPSIIAGKSDFDMPWTKEEADWYRACDQRVMENNRPELHILETQMRADGKRTWLDTNKVPLHDPDGNVIGILGTYEDITEQKEAQAALERQVVKERLLSEITAAIRQSLDTEEIFRTTIEQVGEAFKVCRCVIYVHYLGPEPQLSPVSEYLAVEMPSALSQPIVLVKHPHIKQMLTQDRAMIFQEAELSAASPESPSIWNAMQIQSMIGIRTSYLDAPNGVLMLHQCDRQRHWSPDEIELLESVAAQVGIALAQAQLLKQEQEQRQALEKAKQVAIAASRAKSEFLASMSHELRTPLNAILGFSQLMQRDQSLSSQQQDNLSTINRSGEHLLTLINDILEMSKIEAGRTTLTLTDLHLQQFLQSLQAMMQLKAQSKNLSLTFAYDAGLPTYIKTDEGKLRQILINLLGNAIKFTDKGHVQLRVSVLLNPESPPQSSRRRLRFSIQDSGSGIAPEEHELLFQAFAQTEAGRVSKQGTGLGLPISHKFAQMMNGDITVTSQVGQGSTFDCDIEVQVIESLSQQNQLPRKVIGLHPKQSRYRMLVVDDHLENRNLLMQLLQSVGFETRFAENGAIAVALTESWKPDLVWMDLRMPVMDGLEATRQIKKNVHAPPVIALTANAFHENREQALAAGCDDFMSKPFREMDIWAMVDRHLQVQYIYEEFCSTELEGLAMEKPVEISAERLECMSQDWLLMLSEAAKTLDSDRIDGLLAQIPEEHKLLQSQLKQIAETFAFDRLVKILEQAPAE